MKKKSLTLLISVAILILVLIGCQSTIPRIPIQQPEMKVPPYVFVCKVGVKCVIMIESDYDALITYIKTLESINNARRIR